MKQTKKLLSVILALVMLMTSVSVCFTCFAGSSFEVGTFEKLAAALTTGVVKNTATTDSTSNSSGNSSYNNGSNNKTYNFSMMSYSDYLEMLNVINLVKEAAMQTEAYNDRGSVTSCNSNSKCTSPAYFRDEIANILKNGLPGTSFTGIVKYSENDIDTFLEKVLYDSYYHDNQSKSGRKPSAYTSIVSTNDVAGYLMTLDSYEDVVSSVELGQKYVTYMADTNYKTGIKTNHYHLRLESKDKFMVNTASGVNSKTIDTKKFTDFADMLTAIKEYKDYSYTDFLSIIGSAELDALKTKIAFYDTFVEYLNSDAINPYGTVNASDIINKLYDATDLATRTSVKNNISTAEGFEVILAAADNWKKMEDNHPEYGTYCYPALDDAHNDGSLESNYDTMSSYYSILKDCEPDVKALIESMKGISFGYYDEFTANVKAYKLLELKDTIYSYIENEENFEGKTEAELIVVSSKLMAYKNLIEEYEERVIDSIFPDGYDDIIELAQEVYCEENEWVVYYTLLTNAQVDDKAAEEIKAMIEEGKANLENLEYYYDTYEEEWTPAAAARVLGDLLEKARALDNLYQRIADLCVAYTNSIVEIYNSIGAPVINSKEALNLTTALYESIDPDLYNYLTENNKIDLVVNAPAYDKDTYNAYVKFVNDYRTYKATFGLNVFDPSKPLTYKARSPYEGKDKIKTEDYIVTKENIADTISKVDKILTGTQFAGLIKELTGTDIGDLGTFLNSTVKDLIFSNSFVNIVVKLLYSLVLGEFEKVFSTLPSEVSGFTVTYRKSLYNISEIGNLMLYPSSLAKVLPADEKYDTIREQLTAADAYAASWTDSTETTYKGYDLTSEQSWKNPAIYDAEKDALTLDWGVDSAEDKEAAFYEAFAASMEGLRPLILALLCGEKWTCQEYGSNGKGTEKIETIAEVNVGVGKVYVDLKLGAAGNDGYSNALVPAFEALGIDYNYPTSAQVNGYKNDANFENLAKAIFKPVLKLVDEVAKNPVDKIIEILPNLAYALESGMIVNLLNQLKADIAYEASTRGSNFLVNAAMALIGPELPKGAVTIQVGDILKDALRNSPGIDIEGGLEGILGGLGIVVPGLDVLYIAQCGELKPLASTKRVNAIYDTSIIKDGTAQAYTIKANKEDLTYYILTYVFKLLKNESDLRTLLSSIMKLTIDKADYTGEDGIVDEEALNAAAVEKANPIINTIKSIPLKAPGDIVAAIVELAEAKEYPDSTFSYTPAEENDTVTEISLYTKYWTKEKAQYVADNLVTFVEKTAMLVGYDITEIINDLIGSLYTSANLEKLASLLGDLLSGIIGNGGTVDTVLDIVGKVSTLDTDAIFAAVDSLVNYTAPEFEDGDRDAFVAALKDAIIPFVPIIKLLLIDKRDGNIITLLEQVQIKGYNGYNSGLIPILEAIGCDSADITPYAEFVTLSDDAMVDSVLQPILNLIDDIATDPVNKVVDLIPNIVFFISCNGLQQAVDNLLKPIYIVLDVIRPIYDVPLNINLNLQETLTDLLATANLKSISYNDLKYAIEQMGTLQEYQSANGSTGTKLVVDNSLSADLITLVLYEVLATVITADNVDKIIDKINEDGRLTEQQAKDVSKVLKSLVEIGENDKILFVLFYVFFGVNEGYETADDIAALVDSKMQKALKSIGGMKSSDFQNFVITSMYFLNFLAGALEDVTTGKTEKTNFFKTIIDKIVEIWNRILAFFKIK